MTLFSNSDNFLLRLFFKLRKPSFFNNENTWFCGSCWLDDLFLLKSFVIRRRNYVTDTEMQHKIFKKDVCEFKCQIDTDLKYVPVKFGELLAGQSILISDGSRKGRWGGFSERTECTFLFIQEAGYMKHGLFLPEAALRNRNLEFNLCQFFTWPMWYGS